MTKGIIYEVKLLDWIERQDLEADGNLLKTILVKAPKGEYENPRDVDEVKLNLKIQSGNKVLIKRENLETKMTSSDLTVTLIKILESMKRQEKSKIEVVLFWKMIRSW